MTTTSGGLVESGFVDLSTARGMLGLGAVVEVPVRLGIEIQRQSGNANFPCSLCRKRRVRYRIVAAAGILAAATDPRCLECWTDPLMARRLSAMQQTAVDQIDAGLVSDETHYETLADAD